MNWDLAVTLEGSYVSSIEYDALNRTRSVTYPEDVDGQRKILLPTYNKGGALTRVDLKDTALSSPVNYVDRIAYDAKGQQLLVAYGNGIMTRFLYRSDNFRLLRLKSEKYTKSGLTYTSNSGIKQNYSYEYDLSGNIINISDSTQDCGYGATPNALSRDFVYDALYRLLSATGRETAATGTTPWDDLYRPENENLARGYRQLYDYDKLGNIKELQHIATGGNFTRSFDYGSFTKNALQKISIGSNEYNFIYDVNGNMLCEGDTARHLEYDCADRLRTFFIKTGTAEPSKYTHYLYDGSGNRVKKITRKQGGSYSSTIYIDGTFEYTKESVGYDGIPNLTIGTWVIGSYSSGGEQNILHLMGGVARRIGASLGDSTPAIKYTLTDHLDSSCVQIDTNGTTISLEEYYPFGETSFGSYAKKRYRFCGKEKDEESGLYYYGMRYYSSWTCRFINIDPLAGKYPFYTPYQYTGNNPITFTDLDGQETTDNEILGTPTNTPQNVTPSDSSSTQSTTNDTSGINNTEQNKLPADSTSTPIPTPKLPTTNVVPNNTTSKIKPNSNSDSPKSLPKVFNPLEEHNHPLPGEKGNDFYMQRNGPIQLPESNSQELSNNNDTNWITIARDEIGEKEVRGGENERIVEYHSTTTLKAKDDETPWCSSFVNWTIKKAGYLGTDSAQAKSWKVWGQEIEKPAYGAIAVVKFSNGNFHVGFVVGVDKNGNIMLLGGNQSDSVKISPFKKNTIVTYRLPDGIVPNYSLPLYNNDGEILSPAQTR